MNRFIIFISLMASTTWYLISLMGRSAAPADEDEELPPLGALLYMQPFASLGAYVGYSIRLGNRANVRTKSGNLKSGVNYHLDNINIGLSLYYHFFQEYWDYDTSY